jgi:LAS superfamily LD-carboxypeptidase LdcB
MPATKRMLWVAVALLVGIPGLGAEATDGFPEYQGDEWTDLVREGLAGLPNLNPPGSPGPITGSANLDSTIWGIAFARGYEMRQTPASTMPVQDGYVMQSLTATAWEALQAAAADAGHNIVVHSGYRSVATQRVIFNSKLSGTSTAAINAVLDYSAPPGASRHHTGYALDIKVYGGTIGGFQNTAAFAWLSADNYLNAKRFGFVPSYPPGVPNQGPKPEPWEYVYIGVDAIRNNDEMFFYREDGLFRFYDVGLDGSVGSPLLAGSNYTAGWSSITSVDLDGDGQDEMFFYRDDGLFRYYNVKPDGSLGTPLLAGDGYSAGWSSITSVDLDGDGQDEMFFYRDDGLFRYYNVKPDGSLGTPLLAGSNYTSGWSSITSVDLDGDGHDEMFFYRADGLFRFYDVTPDGSLPQPLLAGTGYTKDWTSITAVNLD